MISWQLRKTTLELWFAFAFVMVVCAIPWARIFVHINGFEYIDLLVYRNYFLFGTNVLEYTDFDKFYKYISSEFLWHYGIRFLLKNTFLTIDPIFKIISFGIMMSFGLLFVKLRKTPYLILLINPLVIDFAFSQLRLSAAMIFLLGSFLLKDKSRVMALLSTTTALFIHTASVLFLFVYFANAVLLKRRRVLINHPVLEFLLLIVIGVGIGILVGPARYKILSMFGDRRTDYEGMDSSISFLLFWIALGIPFFLERARILQHEYSRFPVILVGLLGVNLVTGGYSTRFIAVAMPFVVSAIGELRGVIKIGTIALFVLYAIFQWMYWLRLAGG